MKKDEVEKLIGDLRRELADQREHNRKLREQIESERETFRKSLDDAQAAFEEKQYSEWLKANGKFAERFFEDMVNKHLSVVTSCDYGGEIETSLYYDETVVTSSSDTAVNHHNGLEE